MHTQDGLCTVGAIQELAHGLADEDLKHLHLAGGSAPLALGGDQVAVV